MKTSFYYITSLISGYVILSLELLGFRVLAPYFGYSLYVFGSLIGLILLSLSLGYILGGRWGDRNMSEQKFFSLVLASGGYLFVVGFFRKNILSVLFQLPVIPGSLFATTVLFAPPMIILAALSPYFIRILAQRSHYGVGISAGSIYAVSTIGSLIGNFLTSFFLIPAFGTNVAFFSNVILITGTALFWLVGKQTRLLAGLLFFAAVFSALEPERLPKGVIAQTESVYNHLEVKDFGAFLGLRTDRRHNLIFSFYPKSGKWDYSFTLYNLFGVPALLNDAKSALLLGLGAGSIPLLHREITPELSVTGVEIDPAIVALGKKYFALDRNPSLKIITADARPFLARTATMYDLVEIDLFWGSGEIPFYLSTREFFALTKNHLAENGWLTMNVYDPSDDGKLIGPLLQTIASVFPHAYFVKAPEGSFFVLAGQKNISYDGLNRNLARNAYDPRFRETAAYFKNNLTSVEVKENTPLFTDDWAPLEQLSFEVLENRR